MSTNPGNASSTAAHFIEKVNIIANPTLSGLDKSVIKSTKRTLKPLKMKHISLIVSVTWQRQLAVYDLFRHFENRLKEQHWVITFKTLVVMHILMKEGNTERVYQFFEEQMSILNMAGFHDKSGSSIGYEQTKNLKAYAIYLEEKVAAYRELKRDPIKERDFEMARLRSLPSSGEGNLLDEVSKLQNLLQSLLGCKYAADEIDNIVTMQSFRLLLGDLLVLFALVNEGIIHVLQKFFDMSKASATQALRIYKQFTVQTAKVVEFLDLATKLQRALEFEVPAISHAPVSLLQALEDYVRESPEMAASPKLTVSQPADLIPQVPAASKQTPFESSAVVKPSAKDRPLLDFFGSLEKEYVPTFVPVTAPVMANQRLLLTDSNAGAPGMANPAPNHSFYSNNPFYAAGNSVGPSSPMSSPPIQPQTLSPPANTLQVADPSGFYSTNPFQSQPIPQQSYANSFAYNAPPQNYNTWQPVSMPAQPQTQQLMWPGQQQQAASYSFSSNTSSVMAASNNPFMRTSAAPSPQAVTKQLVPQMQSSTVNQSNGFANFEVAFPQQQNALVTSQASNFGYPAQAPQQANNYTSGSFANFK